jgi:hypothetical protein
MRHVTGGAISAFSRRLGCAQAAASSQIQPLAADGVAVVSPRLLKGRMLHRGRRAIVSPNSDKEMRPMSFPPIAMPCRAIGAGSSPWAVQQADKQASE